MGIEMYADLKIYRCIEDNRSMDMHNSNKAIDNSILMPKWRPL